MMGLIPRRTNQSEATTNEVGPNHTRGAAWKSVQPLNPRDSLLFKNLNDFIDLAQSTFNLLGLIYLTDSENPVTSPHAG